MTAHLQCHSCGKLRPFGALAGPVYGHCPTCDAKTSPELVCDTCGVMASFSKAQGWEPYNDAVGIRHACADEKCQRVARQAKALKGRAAA